jgi:hypothetical protein
MQDAILTVRSLWRDDGDRFGAVATVTIEISSVFPRSAGESIESRPACRNSVRSENIDGTQIHHNRGGVFTVRSFWLSLNNEIRNPN